MGLWNFSKEMSPKVRSGEKKQTIRAKRKDGRDPKVGQKQKLYEGLRTRKSRLIKTVVILNRTPIIIDLTNKTVHVNGVNLLHRHIRKLAHNDGFGNVEDFFTFFGKNNVHIFDGYIYKW